MSHNPRSSVFIHINRTGGTSVTTVLQLPFEHKTAIEKREELGQMRWEHAFKFSLVRNPWDKVLSHYLYRVKTNQNGMGDGHVGFNDWVRLAYAEKAPAYYDKPRMFMPQSDWICDDKGTPLVDFVGRFESLERDSKWILRQLGRAGIRSLPHVNRTKHGPYHGYYVDDTRRIVQRHFESDLERFSYSW